MVQYKGQNYALKGGRWRRKTQQGAFLMPVGFTPFQPKSGKGRKMVRYTVPALKRNKDIKQVDLAVVTHSLSHNTGSEANGIKNSTYTYPAMFSGATPNWASGTRANEFIGSWVNSEYLKQKWRVEFPGIVASHVDSLAGFQVRCTLVAIRVPGSKADADLTNFTLWASDIDRIAKRETFNSDLDSDYLEFATRNRNVKVISQRTLKPSQDSKLKINYASDAVAPPIEFSHNWYCPNFKQRVTKLGDGYGCLNDNYIYCAIFTCNELTANTGNIGVQTSSRFYYTDS